MSPLHLPYISPISRQAREAAAAAGAAREEAEAHLYLPHISPILAYISPISPLHLPYISPIGTARRRSCSVPRAMARPSICGRSAGPEP